MLQKRSNSEVNAKIVGKSCVYFRKKNSFFLALLRLLLNKIVTSDRAFMPRKLLTMSADVVCWLQGSSCRRRGLPQLPEYRIRRGSLSRDRGINAAGIDFALSSPV